MHFSCIKFISTVIQPSSLSISRTFPSSQIETLDPLNNNSPLPASPSPGNHHSTFCLYEFNYSGSLLVFLSLASYNWASLVAQMVKRLPTMRETWVRSLGLEDLLEKEMATHSSILAWRIPWTEDPGRLQSMGSQRVRHDWVTSLHFFL